MNKGGADMKRTRISHLLLISLISFGLLFFPGCGKKEEPEKKAKRMNKKTGPQAQIKEDKIPNAIRINRLVVRNGYFEFTYLFHSGMKNTVTAADVFLNKKDMLFYGNPNAFFRSLVEATNGGYELQNDSYVLDKK